ncbi:hypothetical protein CRUP_002040 [Coryphaenoides rupestris]|nr:hypothetical protein CRUP_002040 [Coryphaenoides rupestris]
MIKMSVDKEVMTLQVPALQSDQLRPPKTHQLHPKSSLQSTHQAPPTASSQRTGKRRYSLGVGFKGLAKRRRRANSDGQSEPVLPSNFLLGGNIFDPLNLNSLLDEEVNRSTNRETPKCSPLPSRGGDPVEILVPRDITDPLNLEGGGAVLLSPLKSRKRPRNRHHTVAMETPSFPPTVPLVARGVSIPPSPLPCELNTSINCRDDVVPPLILPRRHTHPPLSHGHKARNKGDGRQRRRRRTTSVRSSESAAPFSVTQPARFQTPLVGGAKPSRCGGLPAAERPPQKKSQGRHGYQHGGHSRYYGYHGFYGDQWEGRVGVAEDPRLRLLKADWFKERRVLDIGCGSGHVTLAIARRFHPAHILGLDRDQRLVDAATHNIRHFLSHDLVLADRHQRNAGKEEERGDKEGGDEERGDEEKSFPLSFRVSRGPLAAPPLPPPHAAGFPSNITFITEAWPGRGLYDVILCLGVTKWVQLQSGDVGVVRLFKRAYQSLSPGGIFILEPQPWSSYSHSKRTTETTYQNYRTLRLRPEDYSGHLTQTTGFTSYRLLTHSGVQRPVYVFHKGPSHRK